MACGDVQQDSSHAACLGLEEKRSALCLIVAAGQGLEVECAGLDSVVQAPLRIQGRVLVRVQNPYNQQAEPEVVTGYGRYS